MSDTPWLGDACSLVEAFRSGARSPAQELEAVLGAISRSSLAAMPFLSVDSARAAAAGAGVSLPFGGVPIGVKELEMVSGWPASAASVALAGRGAGFTSTQVQRLEAAGVVKGGQTAASEFGGLNVSVTKLHGVTHNPWRSGRTAGGSSGGSAAAVAGGLVPIATGGDGGGPIRIPAGFCGLVGMKGTAGRIPRGPQTAIAPLTVVVGCLARSVRDVARWYDVCTGYDSRDPYSLPRIEGWERGLGTHPLAGRRAVIAPSLGNIVVHPEVDALVRSVGEELVRAAGLRQVDVDVQMPVLTYEWAMSNLAQVRREVGDRWPEARDQLTLEMGFAIDLAEKVFNLDMAVACEIQRTECNEHMAHVFDEVDFIICATNPDVAFPAEVTFNTRVGDQSVGPENNGALTIPANVVGNPAISIPAGTIDGLPVGIQVIGRHHEDALLLDLARVLERERPWPLVAPAAPC